MPNYRSWFPSKYISAEDLGGEVVPLTIKSITQEEMPNGDGEMRPVLYFEGVAKGMVLNKTNAKRIAAMYGEDTDSWIGREILIYPSETDLRGETVPCIRVKQGPVAAAAGRLGAAVKGNGAALVDSTQAPAVPNQEQPVNSPLPKGLR